MHHYYKFFKFDFSTSVFVYFVYDFVPNFIVYCVQLVYISSIERILNLLSRNRASTILIKQCKGSLKFFFSKQTIFINGCNNPLSVINLARTISINPLENPIYVLLGLIAVNFLVAFNEFILFKNSVVVYVQDFKCFLKLTHVLFTCELRYNKCYHSFLKLLTSVELRKVCQRCNGGTLIPL